MFRDIHRIKIAFKVPLPCLLCLMPFWLYLWPQQTVSWGIRHFVLPISQLNAHMGLCFLLCGGANIPEGSSQEEQLYGSTRLPTDPEEVHSEPSVVFAVVSDGSTLCGQWPAWQWLCISLFLLPLILPLGSSSQINNLNTTFVSASTSEDKLFSLNDSLYFSLSLRTTKGQE